MTVGNLGADGTEGRVNISTDAVRWTTKKLGTTDALLKSIAFGDCQFVAVGSSGIIWTSPDGTSWTKMVSNTSQCLNTVAYCNNQFIVVGDSGVILTSTDGTTWIRQLTGTIADLRSVAFGNDKIISVSQGYVLTSSNGTSWTIQPTDLSLTSITFGNKEFIAVGTNGMVLTSTDGTIWTKQTSNTAGNFTSILFDGCKFVALCTEQHYKNEYN
jgi:photosystem II stability/assembly factor-like uncharacterized protein